MLRIGYRAHDFGSFTTASELGERIGSIRPSFIQLAIYKAFSNARDWKDWDEEYIASIVSALKAHGITIAITGCYTNPIHPDRDERRREIERFRKTLSLTKAFECPYVGTETGSASPSGGYSIDTSSPENLSIFREGLAEMVEAAAKNDACVALEPVARTHTISSLERVAAILEEFPAEYLKIIFDPVNLIPYTGIPEKDGVPLKVPSEEAEHKFVSDVLDVCGDRLAAIHCKDYYLNPETGFKIGNIPALTGIFRWKQFAEELRRRNIDVPWLLENLDPATVKETAETLETF